MPQRPYGIMYTEKSMEVEKWVMIVLKHMPKGATYPLRLSKVTPGTPKIYLC